jgi:hypothetical protein
VTTDSPESLPIQDSALITIARGAEDRIEIGTAA